MTWYNWVTNCCGITVCTNPLLVVPSVLTCQFGQATGVYSCVNGYSPLYVSYVDAANYLGGTGYWFGQSEVNGCTAGYCVWVYLYFGACGSTYPIVSTAVGCSTCPVNPFTSIALYSSSTYAVSPFSLTANYSSAEASWCNSSPGTGTVYWGFNLS